MVIFGVVIGRCVLLRPLLSEVEGWISRAKVGLVVEEMESLENDRSRSMRKKGKKRRSEII